MKLKIFLLSQIAFVLLNESSLMAQKKYRLLSVDSNTLNGYFIMDFDDSMRHYTVLSKRKMLFEIGKYRKLRIGDDYYITLIILKEILSIINSSEKDLLYSTNINNFGIVNNKGIALIKQGEDIYEAKEIQNNYFKIN